MAFSIIVTENAGGTHPDVLTLKTENEIINPSRSPIAISLPGGSILGLDMGKSVGNFAYTGAVDKEVLELFVDNVGGTPPFQVGETITGAVGWDAGVNPARTNTPTAVITGGYPNLTSPTSLFVNSWSSTPADSVADHFFVDGETVTGGTSNATATINKAFPSALRLWQVQRYWYTNGAITLTTSTGATFSVQVKGLQLEQVAGKEDVYEFKLTLVQVL